MRAYGPDADIAADPAAVARLIELESARRMVTAPAADGAAAADETPAVGGAPGERAPAGDDAGAAREGAAPGGDGAGTPPAASRAGFRERLTAVRRRTWWIAAAAALVIVVAAGAAWLSTPRPDATLEATGFDVNSGIIEVFEAQGRGPEVSVYQQFEPYHDVGVWSVRGPDTNVCLLVWDLQSGRFGLKCVPPGRHASLSLGVSPEHADGFGDWLTEPSIIDFRLRDDVVDVFVRPAPPADGQPASASDSFTRPPIRSSEFW